MNGQSDVGLLSIYTAGRVSVSHNRRTWRLLTREFFYQRPAATRHNSVRFFCHSCSPTIIDLSLNCHIIASSDCPCTSPHSVSWRSLCSVALEVRTQELVSYRWLILFLFLFLFFLGRHLQKNPRLRPFKSDRSEICINVFQQMHIDGRSWIFDLTSHFQDGGHDVISCNKVLPPCVNT